MSFVLLFFVIVSISNRTEVHGRARQVDASVDLEVE
jgi:hypothetical protein